MVYSNTLGRSFVRPPSGSSGARIADDISLAAVAGCELDRYIIMVTGDKNSDGTGTGPYSVDIGFYTVCPGAENAGETVLIPGTECHADLPDNGVYEVTCQIPTFTNVRLPANFFVGLRFDRHMCGVVTGAPATLGFSADLFDFPGCACDTYLGGYPTSPHASFYLKVYTRDDCGPAHIGYKNMMQAGPWYTVGAGVPIFNDITLGVSECDLIAYEVTVKGFGLVKFDLRSELCVSDPFNEGVIPGTEGQIIVMTDVPTVARVLIEGAPIPLPPDFWLGVTTTSSVVGPIVTGGATGSGRDWV